MPEAFTKHFYLAPKVGMQDIFRPQMVNPEFLGLILLSQICKFL
jgi:hypothetical protein